MTTRKHDAMIRLIRQLVGTRPGGVMLDELGVAAREMGAPIGDVLDELYRGGEVLIDPSGRVVHPGPRFLQLDPLLEELARVRAGLAAATPGTPAQMSASAQVQATAAVVQAVAMAEIARDYSKPLDVEWLCTAEATEATELPACDHEWHQHVAGDSACFGCACPSCGEVCGGADD